MSQLLLFQKVLISENIVEKSANIFKAQIAHFKLRKYQEPIDLS